MANVFIFKSSKKAQWNKKKVGRTSPQRDFDTGARGFMKDKTAHILWLKENAIKSLVPSCYSKLARAIPKTACHGIFNDFKWKLGLKMHLYCLWIKGSSSVLSICFYMLTHDCKNCFKQGLLALTLKLHPLYLLSFSARGIGNFSEGK